MRTPPARLHARTRVLPATETEGTRIKVTLSTGETATYSHTYELHGPEFATECAIKLVRASQYGTADIAYKITGHDAHGYTVAVWLTDDDDDDKYMAEMIEHQAYAKARGINLSRSDFAVNGGQVTLDGMPAAQWIDAMTMD